MNRISSALVPRSGHAEVEVNNADKRSYIVGVVAEKGHKSMQHTSATRLAILVCAAAMVACGGRKIHMVPASTQPAAEGVVELKHDKNGNQVADLKVKHLAKPQNLTPPRSTYIVWVQPTNGEPHKLGELQVNDKLEGEFKAPVPTSSFQIFVTAEDGPTVAQPSGTEVLRQTVGVGQS